MVVGMTVSLDIPSELFQRLQKFAVPLVDTLPSVIEKLADHYERSVGNGALADKAPAPGPVKDGIRKFDPLSPPDLLHTRVSGSFGAVRFRKWNELVRLAHVEAFKKAGTFEALRSATHAQIRKGNHDGDSGFHFVPEIGVSVQGVDAKHAWTYALRLAQYAEQPLRVTVDWRNNAKAAYPGETGLLEWLPE